MLIRIKNTRGGLGLIKKTVQAETSMKMNGRSGIWTHGNTFMILSPTLIQRQATWVFENFHRFFFNSSYFINFDFCVKIPILTTSLFKANMAFDLNQRHKWIITNGSNSYVIFYQVSKETWLLKGQMPADKPIKYIIIYNTEYAFALLTFKSICSCLCVFMLYSIVFCFRHENDKIMM